MSRVDRAPADEARRPEGAAAWAPPACASPPGEPLPPHVVGFQADEIDVLVLDLELREPAMPELTAGERAVAAAVVDGASNAEVAAARGTSVRTVANQLRSIFQKLDVRSRWELARLWARRALAEGAGSRPPDGK